jgi:trans-L-3-hydroxyproline dehydratase
MYGAIITPSTDADLDVFFLHNEGYSTMCGHAIIALTKLVFETGIIRSDSELLKSRSTSRQAKSTLRQ